MRNLKRALSLALSAAMIVGMMVMGASAAGYQDVDASNDHQEAIEVLQAVGIMSGVDNEGNFNPDGSVTRNQMAVIMAHLLNLDYDYYRGTNPFTDVPEWAAPYVAACAAEGVVSGIGNGQYGGDNTVTAAQAALMIMKALGYFQYNEDFGSDWQVATVRQASYINLFDNINANAESALTRGQVAQLVLNGLLSDMVVFTGDVGTTATIGDSTIHIGYRAEYTSKTSSAAKYNTLVGGTSDIAGNNQYYIQLGEELYDGKLVMKADADVFGRPATSWTYDKKDIGTYVNYDLMVSEYTTKVEGGDVYNDIGSEAASYDLTYWVDGEQLSSAAALEQAKQIAKKNTEKMSNSGNGVLTQIFVDKANETLTITEINTYLAKTDDYNEKKETLRLDSIYGYGYGKYDESDVEDLKLDDFSNISEYADGDMVLVTIAAGEVQTIADPKTVSGAEIDEFSKHDYVQADGTKYNYAATGALTDSYNYSLLSDYDSNNLDEVTFNLFLDPYGYMIGIEQVEEDVQYVFITAYDRPTSNLTNKTAEAKAIFADGTEAVIQVNVSKSDFQYAADNRYDWDVENGDATENSWYSFTKKNDVYTLDYVERQFHDQSVTEIDSKHISQNDGTNYFYGNADTNYIVVDVDKVGSEAVIGNVQSTTTGVKNVSIDVWDNSKVDSEAGTTTHDSQGVYTLPKSSGAYIIASVVIGDDGTVSDRYAYLYGEPERERYNKTEDCYYWDMQAVIDGKDTTVTFQSDLPATDSFGEGLYKLSYNKDGYAVDAVAAVHTTDYDWVDEFDPDDTTLIKTAFGTSSQPAADLTAKGETLWITQQDVKRGFALADDCPAVIIEQDENGNADKIVEYSSVEKAIKALDNYDNEIAYNFDGTIIMTVKDGLVTSVLLTDTISKDQPENPVDGDATKVTVYLDDTTIYTVRNTSDATSVDEAKAIEDVLTKEGYTDIEAVAEGGKVTEVTAKQGKLTVKFSVNPTTDNSYAVAATSSELVAALGNSNVHTIYLGSSTYELNAQAITRNVEIIGVPGETVIKTAKTGSGAGAWGLHITAQNTTLKISGVDFVNGSGDDACVIAIKDLGGDGTQQDKISVIINNCSFTGYPWGIQVFNGADSKVTNCTFNCGSYDISVGEVHKDKMTGMMTISGNTYTKTTATGYNIEVFAKSASDVLINNDGSKVKINCNIYPGSEAEYE